MSGSSTILKSSTVAICIMIVSIAMFTATEMFKLPGAGLALSLTHGAIAAGFGLWFAGRTHQDLIVQLAGKLLPGEAASRVEAGALVDAAARLQAENASLKLEIEAQKALQAKQLEEQRLELVAAFQLEVEGTSLALLRTAQKIKDHAQASTVAARGLQAQSVDAAQDVTQLAERVTSVAAATVELSQAIAEVARQAHDSSRLMQAAAREATKASGQVQTLKSMSGRIDEIVALIRAIAEQTNLLALNATIEAARAGDAGRGFAVVAQEVKALAVQTADATNAIDQQIAAMRAAIDASVDAIGRIDDAAPELEQGVAMISSAVVQQRQTTESISKDVAEAALMTTRIDQLALEVSGVATHAAEAAERVLEAIAELDTRGEIMTNRTREFVNRVVEDGVQAAA